MCRSLANWLFTLFLRLAAVLAGSLSFLIIVFLLLEAWPSLNNVGLPAFFTDKSWAPTEELFNFSPMLWGTLLCVLGAVSVTLPLSLGSALALEFYLPKTLQNPTLRLIETLGGVPSVVFGFFGLVVLVPIIASLQAPGVSLLAAILVLALMISPGMIMLFRLGLSSIDPNQQANSIALGISRSGYILHIVLPQALPAIRAGIGLQTARALGETMAVLMVIGNVIQIPSSPFDATRSLTTNIALEMAYAVGDHRSVLFACGLLLMLMVLLLSAAARHKEGHYV